MAGGRVGARVGGDGRTGGSVGLGVGGLPGSGSQANTADRTDRENWKNRGQRGNPAVWTCEEVGREGWPTLSELLREWIGSEFVVDRDGAENSRQFFFLSLTVANLILLLQLAVHCARSR